ncbi:hypothetical protein Glove_61g13 [Diversispora epigaea]|uniref:TLDc domain-containing protein n=1 Tax=Diversispora epigaea TaxID=1348612 RepID=A0A397JLB1_9GLOM|nr:hypothetical protein Glove_61g13 [Diversispora epigaea]
MTFQTRNILLPFPSNIITNEHALEISSWINTNQSQSIENNPYEFKLLFRGSKDGFDVKNIFNICDKIVNTVIVLKVEGTGEILGGYNPIKWDNINNEQKNTQDSFVFSLKTANLKNSILSKVVRNFDHAIYNYPKDSHFSFSNALRLKGNLKTEKRCYCKANLSYHMPIRSSEFILPFRPLLSDKYFFSAVECEVFKFSPRIT